MKKALKIIVSVILILVLCFLMLLLVGTIKEWKPAKIEKAEMTYLNGKNTGKKDIELGKNYKVLTYNTGYGGLGKEEDFFMDGGTEVMPKSKDVIEKNLEGISNIIKKENADFNCLQEIDINSKRSYDTDQRNFYDKALNGNSAYADNFKVFYVPYPIKQCTGKVRAGLYTQSEYNISDGTRVSLPVPFKWPVRLFNLKRCLLVNRVPVEGTDKEFVLINLHLEAYDDGSGKTAQTDALMKFAQKEYEKGNYVIACGDWNQSFYTDKDVFRMPKEEDLWRPTNIEINKKYMENGWSLVYDKSVPSCRLNNQPYTKQNDKTYHYLIDGYLVSPNIDVKKVKTLDKGFEFSDHNPVECEFSLK